MSLFPRVCGNTVVAATASAIILMLLASSSQIVVATALSSSAVPRTVRTIGVVGGSGRLGGEVLKRLLEDDEDAVRVRCLARSPSSRSSLTKTFGKAVDDGRLTFVHGDVTDASSVRELLSDCDACLAVHGATRRSRLLTDWFTRPEDDPSSLHAKHVNYAGVRNIVDACSREGSACRRVVRVTGDGEHPYNPFSILINLLGSMAKAYNYEGERLLRTSDLDYTVVRPGVMSVDAPSVDDEDEDETVLAVVDDGAYLPVSRVAYRDVASVVVGCLAHDGARRATLSVGTTKRMDGATSSSSSLDSLLAAVAPDRREFPGDELLREHRRAVRLGGTALALPTTFLAWAASTLIMGLLPFGP